LHGKILGWNYRRKDWQKGFNTAVLVVIMSSSFQHSKPGETLQQLKRRHQYRGSAVGQYAAAIISIIVAMLMISAALVVVLNLSDCVHATRTAKHGLSVFVLFTALTDTVLPSQFRLSVTLVIHAKTV